jgi:hypothetical protein
MAARESPGRTSVPRSKKLLIAFFEQARELPELTGPFDDRRLTLPDSYA